MEGYTVWLEPVGIALGIGLLIGLEREWAHKDVGLRTFALMSLAGCLGWLIHPVVAFLVLGGAIVMIGLLNLRGLLVDRTLEMTTSVALVVTLLLGMIVAQGHGLLAAAVAVLVTMLLAWKTELVRFTVGLSLEELRSIVLFGVLTLVIYPLLPQELPARLDPLGLLNLRAAWMVVVILSAIGLVNYALLRLYGARGIHFTGILGGLVNSTATVGELARRCQEGNSETVLEGMLLANIAMVARNGFIAAIFVPGILTHGWIAVLLMGSALGLQALKMMLRNHPKKAVVIQLAFPFSLRQSLMFGGIYLLIRSATIAAEEFLGPRGFLGVMFLGGLVSSASTAAAAATLAGQGRIPVTTAGMGIVLASIASLLFHIPIAWLGGLRRDALKKLTILSLLVALLGGIGMYVEFVLSHAG
jgi:uncharacterized membrane protein (DUF4010 family)